MDRDLINSHASPMAAAGQDEANLASPSLTAVGEGRKEVAFIDTSLANYAALEAGIPSGVEVVRIDGSQGGLAQIATWAQTHSGYDAIHILSHGSAGTLHLGTDALTDAALADAGVQPELAEIGRALKPGGDLLLYGCDLAAGAPGQQFIADLAAATGADVAASSDLTGAAALGGNWNLEQSVGSIETASLAPAGYNGLLAGVDRTFNFEDGTWVPATPASTVTETISGIGLTITAQSDLLGDSNSVGAPPPINGSDSLIAGFNAGVTKLTFTVSGNDVFGLNSITLRDDVGGQNLRISANGHNVDTGVLGLDGVVTPTFDSNFAGITSFTITSTTGTPFLISVDDITLTSISAPNGAPVCNVVPAVTGTTAVGHVLSTSNGSWTDPEGDPMTYSYRWYRANDSSGSGAVDTGVTTVSYTLTASDAHKYVRAVVTDSDGHGNTPTANSAWTLVTDSVPSSSSQPAITGTSGVGHSLSVSNGGWTDPDNDTLSYSYQWYRASDAQGTGSSAIAGATGSSYTPITADAHKYVTAMVTANDGHGGTATTSSTWTVVADAAPSNTALPAIAGSAKVGVTLTGSIGTWTDADGDSLTYTYQWFRASDSSGTGATAIGGATAASQTLTTADAHEFIQLTVTANDGYGKTTSSSSAWTAVADSAPVNTGAPTISGTTAVGTTVSATSGTWSDADGDTLTYSYQWYRADDSSGSNPVLIVGANTGSYTLTGMDSGKYVGVYATADDGHGSLTQASSAWSLAQTPPSVSAITRTGGAGAIVDHSATSTQFTVTFSDSVIGVDASDFTLTETGTASADLTSVIGSGSTYTVTVGNISGDGVLRLDLNSAGTGIQNSGSVAIASGYTSGQSYTLDHTAPNAPSMPAMTAGTDNGVSNSDSLTSNQTPTFSGSAEAGSTVYVYLDGSLQGTTSAAGGSWSFTPSGAIADGDHQLGVTAIDAAGNESQPSAPLAFTEDRTAPTVTSVDVPASGTYKAGDVLSFTVHTSEAVYVTGTPTLPISLSDGGGMRHSDYVSGSGTSALTFSYTIQPGDLDGNGIDLGNVDVSSATVTDGAGNVFGGILGMTVPTQGILVDAVAPSVTSVGVPSAGTYYIGQNLDFTVNFSENVVLDTSAGTPRMSITLDTGGTVYADYVSGSGTGTLVFRHTVASGEIDSNGITIGSLGLQGGTIRDNASNDADTTLNSVASTALVQVDGSVPHVVDLGAGDANGAYKAGETITLYLNMDRDVTVDTSGGAPTLALSSGGTATYSGGSGGATLSFTYVIGDGENTSDLDATSTAALSLNGATIRDAGGGHGDADTTLPVPGATHSLGANKDIVIDTTAPTNGATELAFSSDTGISSSDLVTKTAAQTISGLLAALLNSGETVHVSLDGGATWATANALAGQNTWSLSGQTLAGSGTLEVKVTDTAGNDGSVYSRSYVLDTAAPSATVSSMALSNDTGSSASDFVTNAAAQTIHATLSAALGTNDLVYGSLDNGATWTDITAKVTGTALAWDGVTLGANGTIKLKLSDGAGNDGTVYSQAYTLDTTAPAAPSTPALTAASDSGTAGDGVTVDTPVVEGTALANAKVALYDGSTAIGTTVADANGHWSLSLSSLGTGVHSVTARQYDMAGNLSDASAAFSLRLDSDAPPTTLIDGVQVDVTPVSLPGGEGGTQIVVPVVSSVRTDTSGSAGVADIPLASSAAGNLLVAQLAPGYGLSATGGTAVPAANASNMLVSAIKAAASSDTATDQSHMTGHGQSFLSSLPANQPLLVETVVPVTGSTPGSAGTVTLTGSGTSGQSVALVVDATKFPVSCSLSLHFVDFAAIIGGAQVDIDNALRLATGDGASQHFTVATGGTGSVFAGGGDDQLDWGAPVTPTTVNSRADVAPGQSVTLLHGGQGSDTASFNGTRDSFTIEFHNGYEVVSSKADPSAKALVVNVEQLSFTDGAVAIPADTAETTIAGLYQGIYGRQADLYGFEFWANANQKLGLSLGAMALDMIDQGEWARTHTALDGDANNDVGVLYNALFGRAGDAAGIDFWAGAMKQHGLSLEQVADFMVKAPEMDGHQSAATNWDFSV